MTSALASKAGLSLFEKHLKNYEPEDPVYETYTDKKGKTRRRKRELPPGLSPRDAKILQKVKRRARRLDKTFSCCGVQFGWTFIIGLFPVVGDGVNAGLNYILIVKKAEQAEIPGWLVRRMLMNNAVSAGVGLVPLIGDVMVATFKANSRNAALLEEYLRIRGEEYLKVVERNSQNLSVTKPGVGRETSETASGTRSRTFTKFLGSRREKKVSPEPDSTELSAGSAQSKTPSPPRDKI